MPRRRALGRLYLSLSRRRRRGENADELQRTEQSRGGSSRLLAPFPLAVFASDDGALGLILRGESRVVG